MYEAKIVGYACPIDVIISRLRHVQELLQEDERATRAWPDLAHAEMNASEYRHRISGLMRTRADEVTALATYLKCSRSLPLSLRVHVICPFW